MEFPWDSGGGKSGSERGRGSAADDRMRGLRSLHDDHEERRKDQDDGSYNQGCQ